MRKYLDKLISYALENNVSDINFMYKNNILIIYMRNSEGIFTFDERNDSKILEYLRYLTNMDMSSSDKMQSSSTIIYLDKKEIPIRFSYIHTHTVVSGALRILESDHEISIDNLSLKASQNKIFKNYCKKQSGLILLSGITGSGKTTTLYALIEECLALHKHIFTIEDPIEKTKSGVIQIQIHGTDITYESGIRQILRHDPDVIMIGEIRDMETAKMAVRAALTGHLVLSTIHAKNALGVIYRLKELGINESELKQVLRLVSNQRLIKGKKHKGCIYELIEEERIGEILNGKPYTNNLLYEIEKLYKENIISKAEYQKQCTIS